MRAVVMRDRQLIVDQVTEPSPATGEVMIRVSACGICGSDLHALQHADEFVEQSSRGGGVSFDMDVSQDVVMGHEYCGEIVEFGLNTTKQIPLGTQVVSIPALLRDNKVHTIGYSNQHPGGYGEYMRLTEDFLVPVPNGLPPPLAALTEPMAVGLHAVNKAKLEKHDVPLVIGCGPVGLAVIAALKLVDQRPIIAADYSPRRRALAQTMGADIVVDPNQDSAYTSWRIAATKEPTTQANQRPWVTEPNLRPAVIFECVGVPGVIDQIMEHAPRSARIVVVGVCMRQDHFHPVYGINKELNLQFVVAYNRREFSDALNSIADGKISVDPLITATVGLDQVSDAFKLLGSPEEHAKIIVDPHLTI